VACQFAVQPGGLVHAEAADKAHFDDLHFPRIEPRQRMHRIVERPRAPSLQARSSSVTSSALWAFIVLFTVAAAVKYFKNARSRQPYAPVVR
jgi:hypothetical protein